MSITDKVTVWISELENVFVRRALAIAAYTLLAIIIVVGLIIELVWSIALALGEKIQQNYKENRHLLKDFVNSFKETW
jgi:predicted PurR-regulated permease PerM